MPIPDPAAVDGAFPKPNTFGSAQEEPAPEEAAMGMGMMGGMGGFGGGGGGMMGMGRRGRGPGGAPEVKYDPTAWGRYAKILLSSSEFMFIN